LSLPWLPRITTLASNSEEYIVEWTRRGVTEEESKSREEESVCRCF
jgi:hypothetical protein